MAYSGFTIAKDTSGLAMDKSQTVYRIVADNCRDRFGKQIHCFIYSLTTKLNPTNPI
jgi:ATP/ADP translocase